MTTLPPVGDRRFVVQRHRARALHYDFRLQVTDALVSWAVPKGPTLDPDVRRMAVRVEDHMLSHFDFEGAIPAGRPGGGDVIVWDWGKWVLSGADDPAAAIDAGDLHFDLFGEKLAGRFALVRRNRNGGLDSQRGVRAQWLLVHKHDQHAVPGWDPERFPKSVKSGRTNDEVREGALPSA